MTVLRCFAGFLLACISGAAVQVLFVLPPTELMQSPSELPSAAGIWLLLTAIHAAAIAAPFVLIGAILSEKYAARGLGYYLLAGMIFGLALFLARYATNLSSIPKQVVQYVLIATLCSGLIAGLMYWAIAGRRAGAGVSSAKTESRRASEASA
jgi:hypothetical protein